MLKDGENRKSAAIIRGNLCTVNHDVACTVLSWVYRTLQCTFDTDGSRLGVYNTVSTGCEHPPFVTIDYVAGICTFDTVASTVLSTECEHIHRSLQSIITIRVTLPARWWDLQASMSSPRAFRDLAA